MSIFSSLYGARQSSFGLNIYVPRAVGGMWRRPKKSFKKLERSEFRRLLRKKLSKMRRQ